MWRKAVGSGPSFHENTTTSPPFIVKDVGNFTAFEIKVQAVNDMGNGPDPKSTIGYSGEDCELFVMFYPQKSHYVTSLSVNGNLVLFCLLCFW